MIKGTAVSSLGVCVCRWYKCGVNLASVLFAAVFRWAVHAKFLAPSTKAFSRQSEVDVLHWSSMRTPCWQNLAFATYSSTSVFGLVAHSEGAIQLLAAHQTIARVRKRLVRP